MSSLNKITLIGRVGQEPNYKTLPTGASVAGFSIATSEKFKDKDGNKQERTTWHSCTAWSKLADIVKDYVKKGSLIYVEGKIEQREYTNKDGVLVKTYEVRVFSLQMLGGKNDQQPSDQPSNQTQSTQDDLPF